MFKRQLRDYALATYYGADKRLASLLPMALRVARARLRYRIGPFYFSLLGLARVPVHEWNNYIIMRPDFDVRREALSPGAIHGVVDNKLLFHAHCLHAGLPTIPIICYVGGGAAAGASMVERVDDPARLQSLLQAAPAELFVKPVNGAHGDGVFRLVRHGENYTFDDQHGSAVDFFAYLEQRCVGQAGCIIQPRVRSHPQMARFAATDTDSLPTVRVITAIPGGEPQILFACLRMPAGSRITDNFGNGTNGNLVAGIDVQNGCLMHAWRSACRNWPVMVEVESHPDTGRRIAGSRVPLWPEIVDVVVRAQRSLPKLKTIGWDVAVTPDGVVLVELNSNYGVYSLQVAYQRGLKAELAAQLNISLD